MSEDDTSGRQAVRRRPTDALIYVVAAVLAVAAGFAAVYVSIGRPDNRDAPVLTSPKQATPAPAAASGALNTGEMTAFVYKKSPEPPPPAEFLDAKGATRTLADFRGKVVLLNLWATWCAPCRKEMPALDRLQSELGGSGKFEIVAVSVDRSGLDGAKKFLDQVGARSLALYADPRARLATELRAVGMPTTLLIDDSGREVGRLVGPAEWDSADAKRLIASLLR